MLEAKDLVEGPLTDELIAVHVMGAAPGMKDRFEEAGWEMPRYSRSNELASAVVIRMRGDGFSFKSWQPAIGMLPQIAEDHAVVSFVCSAGPCPRHRTDCHNHHGAYDVSAESLPLAIARAALVALKVADWKGD